MRLEELFDKMIPSDVEKSLPNFSSILSLEDISISQSYINELQLLLEQKNGLNEVDDINFLLTWLRKQNYSAVRELEKKLIEAYFSNPVVIEKLTGGESTLFPHQKILPEIDFELLEPVLHLGERVFKNGE